MKDKSFIDKVNFIKEENFVQSTDKIEKQINILDSDINNNNFTLIENKLNELYEKTRVMEDIISYAKEYINDAVIITTDKVKNKLKQIEDSSDALKDSSYIAYTLDMQQDYLAILKDRNGKLLNNVAISNSNIVMSSQEVSAVKIVNSSISNEIRNYSSNVKEIPKPYRTFYLQDGVVKNGVKERINLTFDKPSTINSINISPSNCKIVSISLINELGIEEQVNDVNNKYMSEKKVTGAKIGIASSNYRKQIYEIDNSRIAPDFWSRIKEKEYRTLTGKTTVFDMEKESGLENYKRDYNKYLQDLKKWESEKAAVDNRNKLLMDKWQHDIDEWTRQYGSR